MRIVQPLRMDPYLIILRATGDVENDEPLVSCFAAGDFVGFQDRFCSPEKAVVPGFQIEYFHCIRIHTHALFGCLALPLAV